MNATHTETPHQVAQREIAYWRAEQALDAAMQQYTERLLSRIRQSDELPEAAEPPRASDANGRGGCLALLLAWTGR